MADPQRVIDEARPMLEEFLRDIGLHRADGPPDPRRLLGPFSRWVDDQEVAGDGRFYLASRLGAFICEYLIEACSAGRVVVDGRIVLRVPRGDEWRELDPYATALWMATDRIGLEGFLNAFCPSPGERPGPSPAAVS